MNQKPTASRLVPLLKITLPVLILAGAVTASFWLIGHKAAVDEAAVKKIPHAVPEIRVTAAKREALKMDVVSQGVVVPKIEIALVPEVSGKVVKAHPGFAPGGYFKKGELLLEIDPRDFAFAVTRAQAAVAEAYKELLREREEAKQAESEWQALGSGKATDYVLHKPQLKEREAKLAAAEADLNAAKLQLQRCRLLAPFNGWVRDQRVLPGQYVTAGSNIARLYGDDSAEVSLPIAEAQRQFLALPSFNARVNTWPMVRFTLKNGNLEQHWQGHLVRTKSDLDEKNAMLYAVAEIPKAFNPQSQQSPLMPGMFLHASIEGIERFDLLNLPRTALFAGNQIFSVTADNRLRLQTVEIIRADKDRVIVATGVNPGERIMIDGVELPIDGMKVRIKPEQANQPGALSAATSDEGERLVGKVE
jgi:membrane fusion protein, multidrug efflux system